MTRARTPRHILALGLAALVTLTSASAWAQNAAASEPALEAGAKLEVTARGRLITVPPVLLDAFFAEHANTWDGQNNASYGVALMFRQPSGYEFGLAFDYADLRMNPQFWLANDDPAEDAEYTVFDVGLASALVTMNWFWDIQPWLAPYAGVGVGPGFVIGDVTRIGARPNSACERGLGQDPEQFAPDVCFDTDGEPDPSQMETDNPDSGAIIPVVPVVRLAGGLRFLIQERAVIRLEVGFQDYAFVGVAAGAQF